MSWRLMKLHWWDQQNSLLKSASYPRLTVMELSGELDLSSAGRLRRGVLVP